MAGCLLLVLGGILCSVTSGGMVCVLACCIWHIEHAGMRQGQRMMTAVCGGGRGTGIALARGVIFRVLGDMVATDMGRDHVGPERLFVGCKDRVGKMDHYII